MRGIGIRVYSNSRIYYCLMEKEEDDILNYLDISYLNVPLSIELPEQLNFIRNTLLDILNQYEVQRAVIRLAELNGASTERIYLEGVIQESLSSSNVERFLAGQIAQITKVGQMDRTDFKKYASAEMSFPYIPEDMNWGALKQEERECILACYTSLNL